MIKRIIDWLAQQHDPFKDSSELEQLKDEENANQEDDPRKKKE